MSHVTRYLRGRGAQKHLAPGPESRRELDRPEQIDQAVVGGMVNPPESDGILTIDVDFKTLPELQMHGFAYGIGQDNLSFFGENGGRGRKILPRPRDFHSS